MKLIFREEAQKDLQIILRYYENEASLLIADNFMFELENSLVKFQKFPQIGKEFILKKSNFKVRTFALNKFPFVIFYSINKKSKSIEIVRIIHTSRNIADESI